MKNFKELIESSDFEEMLGTRGYNKYKPIFLALVDRAGISEYDSKDEEAFKKLHKIWSWNWYSAIFSFFWAAYLNISFKTLTIWHYLAFTILFFLFVDLFFYLFQNEYINIIDTTIGLVVSLIFGVRGNQYYLQHLVRRYNQGLREKPLNLILNVFMVYGLIFLYFMATGFIFEVN